MTAVIRVESLRKVFRRRVRAPGVRGLVRSYFGATWSTHEAVRGIDFEVAQGESVALIGPNGAGKSTTIKMLTGILYPSSGEAHVLGLVPWRERARLAMNIATVFGQRSQLWYDLPAADGFELIACIYELRATDYRARRDMLVERFALGALLDTPVRKLSLGQRMRCEIAAALLHRPRVLFLDEPTIGLDVLAKQEIRALVRELNLSEGVTVLLTSHDAGDIEHLCQRVLLINHGSLVFADRVSALASRYRRQRRVEVKLERPLEREPYFAGASVVAFQPLAFTLELDDGDDARGLGALLARVVEALPVADIRIADAPLEDVIGRLYRAAAPEVT
jgi:ABC-2 type transport system ATP-binding protein